ncbi:MAG: hypothetical protein ACK46Q_15450, partial [Hyphomonas sp.]
MPMNRLGPALLTALAVLAGCATETLAPASTDAIVPTEIVAQNPAAAYFKPTAELSPTDAGIMALADAVAGADLISFMGHGSYSEEDARLKAALTLALIEQHDLGLVILDTPCGGASILDTYIGGAQTGDLAVDIVRQADIVPALKSLALADLMTQLRGWNAVNIDAPVRIAGKGCTTAREAAPGRPAIFWGLTELPASMSEKDMAAAARGEPAARNHVWIVQDFEEPLGITDGSDGWIDLRALPDDPQIGIWRDEQAKTQPWMKASHPWAA